MKSLSGIKTYSQDYIAYTGSNVGRVTTGWNAVTITSGSFVCYKLLGNMLFISFFIQGTSNSTSVLINLYPYNNIALVDPSVTTGFNTLSGVARKSDNGGAFSAAEISGVLSTSTISYNIFNGVSATAWTASGTKVVGGQIVLPVNL